MPDPIFAAEMAALAAAHRAREKDRTGDGMAVVAPSFMNFTSERVPVPKDDSPRSDRWVSRPHYHSGASACLETEDGEWFTCAENRVRYHRHGERLMAHLAGDRRACPEGVSA